MSEDNKEELMAAYLKGQQDYKEAVKDVTKRAGVHEEALNKIAGMIRSRFFLRTYGALRVIIMISKITDES